MKLNFVNNNLQRDFFSDFASNGVVQTAANISMPGSGAVVNFLSGIFGGNKPNPNDWQGWDALDSQYNSPPGTSPAHWVLNDGDSVPNEAGNILSYIKNKNSGLQKVVEAIMATANIDASQALERLYTKLTKGGFAQEAAALRAGLAPRPVNTNVGTVQSAVNAQQNYLNGGNSSNNSNYQPSNNAQQNNTDTNNNSNNNGNNDKKNKTVLYIAVAVVAVSVIVAVISFIKKK